MSHCVRSLVVVAALVGAAPGLLHAEPVRADPVVEWRDGRLRIDARDAGLRDLLAAVAARTGIEMRGLAAIEGRISLRVAGLSLDDALDRLLAQVNHARTTEPAVPGRPARVVVTVPGRKADANAARADIGGAAIAAPHTQTTAHPDTYPAVERMANDGDVFALREAALNGDAATRAFALQRLAQKDPAEAQRVSMDVRASGDPAERVVALQVMGGFAGADVTEALRVALDDPDPDVRRTAVTGIATRASPAAAQLLARALQDPDESVRALAETFVAARAGGALPGASSR